MNRHLEAHSLGVKVTVDNAYGENVVKYLDNGTIDAFIAQITDEELLAHGFDVNDVSHLMLTDTNKTISRGDFIDLKYEVKEVVIGHKYTKVYLKEVEQEEYIELDDVYTDGYQDGWQDGYEAGGGQGGAVTSVNGKVGDVVLDADDVGAIPAGALNSYATKTYVNAAIDAVEEKIPSIEGLASQAYVDSEISSEAATRNNADLALQTQIRNVNTSLSALTDTVDDLSDEVESYETTTDVAIATINSKIPQQATSSNQLADKDFVNSTIATNTGNFQGTYDSVQELPTTDVHLNDYAFVKDEDALGNKEFDRYKYKISGWAYEYTLNNSTFTAVQWAAINSAITAADVALIETALQPAALNNYYTKSEVEGKGYATQSWVEGKTYATQSYVDTGLLGKSDTGHTHDDRYYTETEIDTALAGKQATLTAGDNITIENNVISAAGGYTFTDGLTETDGTVSWDLNDRINYSDSSNILSIVGNSRIGGPTLALKTDNTYVDASMTAEIQLNGLKYDSSNWKTFPASLTSSNFNKKLTAKTNSYGAYSTLTLDATDDSDPKLVPHASSSNTYVDLGASDKKWGDGFFNGTVEAQSLSDGTTTKTMTEVLAGGGGGEPDAYVKSASVNNNTLTLTNKDDTTVTFTPQGGGGSSYTFTNGLTETDGVVSWDLNDRLSYVSGSSNTLTFTGNSNYASPSLAIKQGYQGTFNTATVDISLYPSEKTTEKPVILEATQLGDEFQIKTSNKTSRITFDIDNRDKNNPFVRCYSGKANTKVNLGTSTSKWGNGYFAGDISANNIPPAPSIDGNYVLKCSIVDGAATYSWVAEV